MRNGTGERSPSPPGATLLLLAAPAALWSERPGIFLGILAGFWLLARREDTWHPGEASRPTQGLALTVIFATTLGLYYPVLESWWLHDDPFILRHALRFPVWQSFVDSERWRQFSPINLTPLLILSFAADARLFGLSPAAFYAHQLALLLAVGAMGYRLLQGYFSPLLATLIILLFLASAPVATVIQQLMTRHYLEGLLLALLAFWCYQRALHPRQDRWAWLGGLCYLLACTAKEIYAPLPAILVLLPVAGPGWRIRCLMPFALVAMGYAGWRLYMLRPGNALHGGGPFYPDLSEPDWFLPLSRALGWENPWQGLALLALAILALAVVLIRRRWALLLWLGTILTVVMGPLLPVFTVLQARSALLLAACLAGLAGLGLSRLPPPWPGLLGAVLLASGMRAAMHSDTWENRDYIQRHRVEGRHVLQGPADTVLLTPLAPADHHRGLAWLRRHWLAGGPAPAVCYDACGCAEAAPRLLRFEDGTGLVAATSPPPGQCAGEDHHPLTVMFRYDPRDGVLAWRFGPHETGVWAVLSGAEYERLTVGAEGSTPLVLAEPVSFRVAYHSPAGWFTRSPLLTLDPASVPPGQPVSLQWQRETPANDSAAGPPARAGAASPHRITGPDTTRSARVPAW